MPHHTPLIGTIVAGLVVAFIMGAIAHRLRISPLAGYLCAGIVVGPFTPGFVADGALAAELAEIGVILLMFGVGLHFSLRDLLAVKNIAVPGAVVQIAVATLLGIALSSTLGWGLMAGIVFGLALSVASTVVLLRALQARDLIDSERGKIAVGWLIVEDLAMVLALVLLPAIGPVIGGEGGDPNAIWGALGITLLKVCGFVAVMLVIGRRIIPWALHWVAHTGSRELFRLAVLAIALGVAFGAALLFDVSFALGAFFAGMILGETHLAKRATEETLPLRDAFAVLFFVSVGMLFDPAVIMEQPLELLATVGIIVIGKSIAAYGIVRAFGYPNGTALTVAASLAQIGEFSFILAGLGVGLAMLPEAGRDLILAGAMISILIHPLLFSFVERWREKGEETAAAGTEESGDGHIILVGHGRVGRIISAALAKAGKRFILIEEQADRAAAAGLDAERVIIGNAADPRILCQAALDRAGTLLIAVPEGFDGGQIAEQAHKANPALTIVARAHSDAEVEHLERHGAAHVIMGEREIAKRMIALAG